MIRTHAQELITEKTKEFPSPDVLSRKIVHDIQHAHQWENHEPIINIVQKIAAFVYPIENMEGI